MIHVYRIGVHLALQNGVSAGIGVIAGHMLGLQRHIDGANMGFNKMGVAIAGAAGIMAGAGLLKGMAALSSSGERYLHQLAQMKAAGMTAVEIAEAEVAARRTAGQVMTTSASENLKAIRELRMVFGDTHHATQYLPMVQQAQAVMASTLGADSGAAQHSQVWEMARASELRGNAQNPDLFRNDIDAMVRASVASGGRITGAQFHTTFRNMRGARAGKSDEFLYEIMPTLMQELGAPGAGSGMATLHRAVIGGRMTEAAKKMLLSYGLIDPSKVTRGSFGRLDLAPGAVRGSDLFQSNPLEMIQQVWLPALAKKGVTTPDKLRAVFARLFSDRTAEQIALILAQQGGPEGQIRKDQRIVRSANGMMAFAGLAAHDPVLARMMVKGQWYFATEMLGKAITPVTIKLMLAFAGALNAIGNFAAKHPTAVGVMFAIAAGLGVLLVVLGAVAIAGAAIAAMGGAAVAGWIVGIAVAIAGLGAAIYFAITKLDWSAIGQFFAPWGAALWKALVVDPYEWLKRQVAAINWSLIWSDITNSLGQAWTWMKEKSDAIAAWANGLAGTIGGAIDAFRTKASEIIGAIVDWIIGIPGRLLDSMRGANGDPAKPGTGGQGLSGPNGSGALKGFPDFVDPDAPLNPSRFVPSAPAVASPQPVILMLDGKAVGHGVMPYIGRAAAGPINTAVRLDNMRALAPAAMT